MHPKPPPRRLEILAVAGFAVLAVVIVAIGAALFRQQEQAAVAAALENLGFIADLKVGEVFRWRGERVMDGRFFFNAVFVSRDVEALLDNPESPSARGNVLDWLTLLKGGERYERVTVFSPDGQAVLSVPAAEVTVDARSAQWIASAGASNQVILTDLHRRDSPSGKKLGLEVVFPVRKLEAMTGVRTDQPPEPAAVIVLEVDPDREFLPRLQVWPTPSDSAETMLVRPEADELVVLNHLRHRPDSALELRIPRREFWKSAGADDHGRDGTWEGQDYRGSRVLAAIRRVQGTSWYLAAKIDREEVYGPLRARFVVAGAALLALLLAGGLGALSMWRLRQARFLRREVELERERASLAARLAFLTDHANDIIVLTDPDWRLLEVNQRGLETYGFGHAELRQMRLEDLSPPELRAGFARDVEPVHATGAARYETLHRRRDGSALPVEVSLRTVVFGGVRYGMAIVRDMTVRRQHEHEIQRLNQLYAVLSQINQAIVQAESPDAFLQRACLAVVDKGAFELAWVGRLDPGSRAVTPIAAAGLASPEVPEIRVVADDRPEGRGPAGRAVRTGQPQIANDFLNDPDAAPWRAGAARFGLRSAAAFPIRMAGEVWGVLALYSSETGFFRDKEIQLLREVAEDMSFALDHFQADRRRRDAERAWQESEQRFSKVFHTNPGLVSITTLEEGRFIDVNEGWFELVGYRREELIGHTSIELGLWIARADRSRLIAQLKAEGAIRNVETQLRCKSGTVLDMLVSMGVLDLNGTPGIVTVATDITDRKRFEERLSDNEEQFRAAFEQAAVGMAQTATDGRVTRVNQRLCDILGYTREELLGRLVQDLAHPEDAAAKWATIRRVIEGEVPSCSLEQRYRQKDGRTVWADLTVSAVRGPEGQARHVILVIEDITRRRQTEQALRDSEERLRLALTAANQGLYDLDIGTGVITVSAEYATMLGYDPGDFPETVDSWTARLHPADREHALSQFRGYLSGDVSSYAVEFRLKTAGGEWKWILSLGKIVAWDGEGRPARMLGTHTDLTDRKRAEDKVRKLNAELEERVHERTAQLETANRELEAFSYTVSHDLRAPLRAVDGFARILVEDFGPRLPTEAQGYVQRVREGAQRMAQLIDDLLTFSRLGRQPLRRQEVDHRALVDQVLVEFEAELAGRQIDWNLGPLPPTRGDASLLKQVWVNLLSNAIKFTARRERAVIRVGFRTEKGEGIYFVTDNGAGFNMRYAQRLFGVFNRLHRADEFPGTGVGLAIVQRIVQRHGGRIWAEAVPEEGATFHFTLGAEGAEA